jgi:hypothetical protein
MKKIQILLLSLVLGVSSAFATVSFTGVALSGVTSDDASGNYTFGSGSAVSFFDTTGLILDQSIFTADLTSAIFGNSTYTSSFFGATAGHVSNVTVAENAVFAAILTDGATGNGQLFTSGGWVAPADGSSVSVGTVTGAATLTQAVPEPSTYALLAGFAAFIFVAIRRRNS